MHHERSIVPQRLHTLLPAAMLAAPHTAKMLVPQRRQVHCLLPTPAPPSLPTPAPPSLPTPAPPSLTITKADYNTELPLIAGNRNGWREHFWPRCIRRLAGDQPHSALRRGEMVHVHWPVSSPSLLYQASAGFYDVPEKDKKKKWSTIRWGLGIAVLATTVVKHSCTLHET